jgi:hypothetical protein
MLATGAGVLGFWVSMALMPEDTEALESPLVLAAARQLVEGPWGLYGPYGKQNPLVLIHAPLYYHLAALGAWPLARAGLDPVSAALVAGRSLSVLGLLATLAAAYRLARLDEAPRRVGWWAILLFAATPIHGGVAVAVRPDMLGVAFQTTGVLLALSALRTERHRQATLLAAFASFGLAIAIKQLFVATPAITTILLLAAWRRGKLAFEPIGRAVLLALSIVGVVYGTEELATGGRMSQSLFGAATNISRVHPGDWSFAGRIGLAVIWKCVGWISILVAAGVVMIARGHGWGRSLLAASGTGQIGLIVAMAILQFFVVKTSISLLIACGLVAALLFVLPACILLEGRSLIEGPLDRSLWIYWVGEIVLMMVLCRLSTGAWYNYAIQAVVFASVLTARALSRALEGATSSLALLPVAIAVLAVPAFALTDAKQIARKRQADRSAVARIVDRLNRPSPEFFFVDRPGDNRVHGRLDLVHDNWLYPVFESMGLAEPRSIWLRHALETGPVRVVLMTSAGDRIECLDQSLAQLGYVPRGGFAPFHVWIRPSRDLR